MITARQKVLNHLKKNREVSAREIARALQMSAPNVRHHLSTLRADGLVEFVAVNNRAGRGRPEKVYSLSQAALGDNLPALTNALLEEANSNIKLEAVAGHLLDMTEFAGLPATKRLPLLVEKLNALHYQAHWEAGATGPLIVFGRCPYAKVIEQHPELCKMDVALLKGTLGRPVISSTKNEPTGRGLCPFIFRVG